MKETKVEIRPDALVLVVDDEQDIRDASERILSRVGYQVQKASRGDEALDILNKKSVDIMLLDLKMPGMDGLEVLERIRKQNTKIQVIVITGYATVETAIEAMKQGAYDFIPKPFEPDQLRIVVNRAWEKIHFIREAEKLELERNRTLSDLDTEKSRIRTIIESFPSGVMVTNPKGRVVLMNRTKTSVVLSWKFPKGNMWTMMISRTMSFLLAVKNIFWLEDSRFWGKERNV